MKRRSFVRNIADKVGLHGESIPGVPLVEINGDDRVLIENHLCVLGYSENEVTVRTSLGCIKISGRKMVLSCLRKEQLVIHGKIDGVTLLRGG